MGETQQEALTTLYTELEFASLLKKEATGGAAFEIDFDPPDASFQAPEPMAEKEADEIIDSLF